MGSNVSTFGGFSTARLGIYAAQKAMEVVGNNISNINTPNYTRQVLNQKSLHIGGADHYTSVSNIKVGAGALCTGVSQLRDPYLDIRYRNEMANVGAAAGKLSGLGDLSAIFDEVAKGDEDNGVLEQQINDFLSKLQDLNNYPNRDEYNNMVRGSAEAMVIWFNEYGKQLDTLQKDQEAQFRQDVTEVNTILTSIRDLSESIRKANIHGNDALELKDERNALIDQLSAYMRINVKYVDEDIGAGMTVEKLVININSNESGIPSEGPVLIDGNYCTQLSLQKVPKTDENGDPVLDDKGNPVMVDDPNFKLQLARLEDRRGKLKPGANEVVPLSDTTLYGSLQSAREMLTRKGEYSTEDDIQNDPNAATKRGIPFYKTALDHLARKFAQMFNEANSVNPKDNPGFYKQDGNGQLVDANGAVIDTTVDGWEELAVFDEKYKDELKAGALFSNNGAGDDTTNITASNISISYSWSHDTVQVVRTKDPDKLLNQSTFQDNIAHMVAMMGEKLNFAPTDMDDQTGGPGAADGTVYFEGSFQGMLTKICSTLANDTKTTSETLDNFSLAADDLYMSRDGVSGVDLNDEAVSMIQYQKSYTAACRLLTTLDEMLERLISNTGIVGR